MRKLIANFLALSAFVSGVAFSTAASESSVSANTYPAIVRVCVENSTQLMRVKAVCNAETETREVWRANAFTPLERAVCVRRDGLLGYSSEQECDRGTKFSFTVHGATDSYIYGCVQVRTKLLKRVTSPRQCAGRVLRWLLTKQAPATCANRGAECVIGDIGPGGGVVFFVDTADEHPFDFLEAARYNWYQGAERTGYTFCDRENGVPLSDTPTDLGTGEATTELLLNICNNNPLYDLPISPKTVVHFVNDYNYKGLTDWFIPSWDEMQALITAHNADPFVVVLRAVGYCTTKITLENVDSVPVNYMHMPVPGSGAGSTTSGGQCALRPIRAE